MTPNFRHPLELVVGVVVLVSVASIPMPGRGSTHTTMLPVVVVDPAPAIRERHLSDLRDQAEAQRQEILGLTAETQQLADAIRSQTGTSPQHHVGSVTGETPTHRRTTRPATF